MKSVYENLYELDKRCVDEFGLSEDLLMENAARGMAEYIKRHFPSNKSLLVVSGSGNNGADGIALARMLHLEYEVSLFLAKEPKSPMAKLQLERAKRVGVVVVDEVLECDVVVDAMFGSGLTKALEGRYSEIVDKLNSLKAYKIACDMPSGLLIDGRVSASTFRADTTITMGSYKKALFSDLAKEYVGKIECVDLGVSNTMYERESECYLLEMSDLVLPTRESANTHKGSFGHLALFGGEKEGASIIAALSAISFGAGLCTIISEKKPQNLPYEIMHSSTLAKNTTAIAIGMGLGRDVEVDLEITTYSLVLDADIFFSTSIKEILQKCKDVVLTPHPKEFCELLRRCKIGEFSVDEIQNRRFELASEFSKRYPNAVLLLKGANQIIAYNQKLYINPYGTQALAKGGSGDVLSGLIGSLLAQGYSTLEASLSASLAQSKAAMMVKVNNYALTPKEIIEQIKRI